MSIAEAWSRGTAEEVLKRIQQLFDANDNFTPILVVDHFLDRNPDSKQFRAEVHTLFDHRAALIKNKSKNESIELAKAALNVAGQKMSDRNQKQDPAAPIVFRLSDHLVIFRCHFLFQLFC